jgi:hypothetical protein
MSFTEGKNYYDMLGVPRDASLEEIRTAYKEIARVYHPDSQYYSDLTDQRPNGSQVDIFKQITAAYHTLINEQKRSAYDQTLPPELPDWEDPVDEDAEILAALEKLGVDPEVVGMNAPPKSRARRNSAAYGIFGSLESGDLELRDHLGQAQFNKTAFGHGEAGLAKRKKVTLTNLLRPTIEDKPEAVPQVNFSSSHRVTAVGADAADDRIQQLLIVFALTGGFCFIASVIAFLLLK